MFVLWMLVALIFLTTVFVRQVRSDLKYIHLSQQYSQNLYMARGILLYVLSEMTKKPDVEGSDNAASNQTAVTNGGLKIPAFLLNLPMFKDLAAKSGRNIESSTAQENGEAVLSADSDEDPALYNWQPRLKPYKITIEGHTFYVLIVPENMKLNINLATEKMLEKFFQAEGVKKLLTARQLAGAIKDWTDPDSFTRRNGAENGYYETLTPPYKAKNKAFDNIEEIINVRHMTGTLFSEIKEDITVFTQSSQINANFAPRAVLAVIPGITEAIINEIISRRKEKLFSDISEIRDITGGYFDNIAPYITIKNGEALSITVQSEDHRTKLTFIVNGGKVVRSYY